MKAVTGFTTSQGRFFESATEAKFDEARESLYEACEEHGINLEKFLDILKLVRGPLFVYLTQEREAEQDAKRDNLEPEPVPDTDSEDDLDAATIKRPARKRGRSKYPETI